MKQEYDFSEGVRGKFFRDGAKLRFPASDEKASWAGPSGRIGVFIEHEAQKSLHAYREQPKLVNRTRPLGARRGSGRICSSSTV